MKIEELLNEYRERAKTIETQGSLDLCTMHYASMIRREFANKDKCIFGQQMQGVCYCKQEYKENYCIKQ